MNREGERRGVDVGTVDRGRQSSQVERRRGEEVGELGLEVADAQSGEGVMQRAEGKADLDRPCSTNGSSSTKSLLFDSLVALIHGCNYYELRDVIHVNTFLLCIADLL